MPGRLPSLTGLRFPAALLVFAYHASLQLPTLSVFADKTVSDGFNKAAAQAGALGVTFFFVLSGFVLTWSAREGDTARSFWRRRLVKIYPNYVVAWILAMVLFAAAYTPAWQATVNLLMLQVWVPDFFTNFSVNPPSWSLGAEAIFYAAFPLLLLLIRKIHVQHLKFWIAGVLAAVIATPLLSYVLLPDTPGVPGGWEASELQYFVAYILPPVRLLDFALGILIARAVATGRWRDIGIIWSGLLLIISYPLASFVPYLYGQRAVCIIPIVLLIAAVANADVQGGPTFFRHRAMVWLGEISFAFYLLHFIVITVVKSLLGNAYFSTPVGIAILAADLVIAIVLSWALYAGFERPITRRWGSHRPSARPTPAIPTQAVSPEAAAASLQSTKK